MAAQDAPASAGSWVLPDLDAAWWLTRSPVGGGPRYVGNRLVLPDVPGQGITGLAADPPSTGDESP
jgi:hypothetical protein